MARHRKSRHRKHGRKHHHSKRAWDDDDDVEVTSESDLNPRDRIRALIAERYAAMSAQLNHQLLGHTVYHRDNETVNFRPVLETKPRAPRKKKEPPLGTIADVTARPVRKIRIVKE